VPKRTVTDADGDKRRALRQAAYTTKKADTAETSRNAAIRFAADNGASLREISEATGIPHMTVKRIIERASALLPREER
jgi:DNA invertase Pin-like site-specific DNA recombinase